MTFSIRRVVTRRTPDGDVAASDGPPPRTIEAPGGFAVSELLWLDGPADSPDAGDDRTDAGFPLEPPAGGSSSRIVRLPPGDWLRVAGDTDDEPGMHATDTLDLVMILDGEIVLGTDEGEYRLVTGDVVVQRGARHRWRVEGDGPCTYWVTMLRPADDAPSPPLELVESADGVRRVVTGGLGDRDARVAPTVEHGGFAMTDLWQTNGPVSSVVQGGDDRGGWQLLPLGGGTSFRVFSLQPAEPSDAGWHATETIDIDVVLEGRVLLELRGGEPVELGPGDVVVQRGTDHRWSALDGAPFRMATVMITAG